MMRFIVSTVLVFGAVLLILILNSTGAFAWMASKFAGTLIPKTEESYATAMADLLVDTPKCAPYRAQILEARTEKYLGPGRAKIVNAFTAASAAGCRKQPST